MSNNNEKLTVADTLGCLYNLCNAYRLCIIPFTRRSFGSRSFEPHGMITIVGLLFLACGYRVFEWYLYAWIAVMLCHRIEMLMAWRKNIHRHSRYGGFPWLTMYVPDVKSETAALRQEPALVILIGLLFLTISEEVGLFLLVGSLPMGICIAIEELVERQRVQSMRDAELEMRYYRDRYRRP